MVKALPLIFALLATTIVVHAAETPRPDSLPNVTLDCFQSFTAATARPEDIYQDISIDGDNFDTPVPRFRLEVVDRQILKIVEDPKRPALRKEHGIKVFEMTRDFTGKHKIVGWKETDSTRQTVFIVNFDDLTLSVLRTPSPKVRALIQFTVLRCRKAEG
jgi:hypothetical protein